MLVYLSLRIFSGISAVALFVLGIFFSLYGALYLHTYFDVYLPNKKWVEECIPSGGSCSINGSSDLDISGIFAIIFVVCAVTFFVLSYFLYRFTRRKMPITRNESSETILP